MIKKALTKPKTLHELYNLLYHSHTMHSLKIELDFLIQIGSIILENNLYKLKQFSYICKRKYRMYKILININSQYTAFGNDDTCTIGVAFGGFLF